MDSFFAFIMFILGIYIVSAAVGLRRDGKINPSLMRTPKNAQMHIRDLDGFAAYMYPKVLVFGITTLVVGMWFLLCIVLESHMSALAAAIMEVAMIVVFFVVLFWYRHHVKEAEKKFS